MTDPNHDLIGYEFDGADGIRWCVTGSDVNCGMNYVHIRSVDGKHESVRQAGIVRRCRELARSGRMAA